MNAELVSIARITAEELDAAVALLRDDEQISLELMTDIAGTMAAGTSQLGLALFELRNCCLG